ncbi:methylglyoxal synthase [Hathewaya histolytica]|uniref:Methylglyoxal synthase n=1 Tax=Hathewaya histolytica TaxID=1498 RepID=A0A4U9RJY7_HATHI|nr:methylglyoxal synthase [Hathewaya histolytica]VTQ92199.1 methylglyoxal synthase [Hathewaya histolytica]
MNKEFREVGIRKNIALVAHDNKKKELLEWVNKNKESLSLHNIFATGTTGEIISNETGLCITSFKSGPLGGDQQIGATIVNFDLDILIFFWDPLESQPHDPDIRALLRIATLYNIPCGTNKSSADFIISSPYMNEKYIITLDDHAEYANRHIQLK